MRAEASLSFRLLNHCYGRGEPLITPEILAGDEILAAAKLGQAPNRPR